MFGSLFSLPDQHIYFLLFINRANRFFCCVVNGKEKKEKHFHKFIQHFFSFFISRIICLFIIFISYVSWAQIQLEKHLFFPFNSFEIVIITKSYCQCSIEKSQESMILFDWNLQHRILCSVQIMYLFFQTQNPF